MEKPVGVEVAEGEKIFEDIKNKVKGEGETEDRHLRRIFLTKKHK